MKTTRWIERIIGSSIIIILIFLWQEYFLAFHIVVEFIAIIIGMNIFFIVLNFRDNIQNEYLKVIGISFLPISILDLIHTLFYRGMYLVNSIDTNEPTQIWLLARYMQAFYFLIGILFINRKNDVMHLFIQSNFIAIIGLISIWIGFFPNAYVEGIGLTFFKKVSEYLISFTYLLGIILIHKEKDQTIEKIKKQIIIVYFLSIISELSFSLYTDVTGIYSFIGHILKAIIWFILYIAIVERTLKKPIDMLYYDLKNKNEELVKQQEKIKTLEGMFSICMYCKDIKTTNGTWEKIDIYLRRNSDINFSHGVCENCYSLAEKDFSVE